MQRVSRYSVGKDTEELDNTPIAMTVNAHKPPTLEEMFRAHIRAQEASQAWDAEGPESPEEADDFEPDWDEDVLDMTPYELVAMAQDDNPPGADPDGPVSSAPLEAPQETQTAEPSIGSASPPEQSSDAK